MRWWSMTFSPSPPASPVTCSTPRRWQSVNFCQRGRLAARFCLFLNRVPVLSAGTEIGFCYKDPLSSTAMRVLVVEDDKKIASFVGKGLKEAGFAVDHADNGADGLDRARHHSYDAAVIDVMLPQLDGLSLIERLRTEKITTPVLILSAKRAVDDRV